MSCFCNIATQIGEKYFYESRLLCNELQIKVILSKWVNIIVCWVQFQAKMFRVSWSLKYIYTLRISPTKLKTPIVAFIQWINMYASINLTFGVKDVKVSNGSQSILQTRCSLLHNELEAMHRLLISDSLLVNSVILWTIGLACEVSLWRVFLYFVNCDWAPKSQRRVDILHNDGNYVLTLARPAQTRWLGPGRGSSLLVFMSHCEMTKYVNWWDWPSD